MVSAKSFPSTCTRQNNGVGALLNQAKSENICILHRPDMVSSRFLIILQQSSTKREIGGQSSKNEVDAHIYLTTYLSSEESANGVPDDALYDGRVSFERSKQFWSR